MALYSRSRGWVSRHKRPIDTGPNPYDPGSVRFAERHAETETPLQGGLVRVDVGAPVPRLPQEPKGTLRKSTTPPAPTPEPAFPETPSADLRRPARDPREFKPGIGRG